MSKNLCFALRPTVRLCHKLDCQDGLPITLAVTQNGLQGRKKPNIYMTAIPLRSIAAGELGR